MNLDNLRKIAEEATDVSWKRAMTINPETVLALLNRVEKAERRIERLKNREQKAFEKLRESKAAIARVREVFPGADDPCLPKSCTHVDCEVMNALEGDE